MQPASQIVQRSSSMKRWTSQPLFHTASQLFLARLNSVLPLHTRSIDLPIPLITPPHNLQRTLDQSLPNRPCLINPIRIHVVQLQRDLREDTLRQPLAFLIAVSRIGRGMPDESLTQREPRVVERVGEGL